MSENDSIALSNKNSLDEDNSSVAGFDHGIVHRVLSAGVRAASPVDLIAIGFARREADVAMAEGPSRKVLQRFGSLRGLSEASRADLGAATGQDDFEVLRSMALMELGRRMAAAGTGPKNSIDSANDVIAHLDHLRYEKREHFVVILLDAKNAIIRIAPIHVGTLTMSVVGAREVFREAIRDGASAIIVAHNHPSGDPTPSPEDYEVTKQLVEVGRMLDIPVLDHVVIGERRHFSFAQTGGIRST
jgi:DNA repair protein RadC